MSARSPRGDRTAPPTHVIVGASLAGAKAAETLRSEGFDGRVIMLGAEQHRPYERPPLSKGLLRRETSIGDTFVHGDGFYADNDIDLRLGVRVRDLSTRSRLVHLEDGDSIAYDRLLLATGAQPRHLRLPGADLEGIHYLRDLPDMESLQSALQTASKVAVVGTGWIGSEVAASVRQLGIDVALIGPGLTPLAGVLGREVGEVYRAIHAEHGVELHLGHRAHAFLGERHVTGVRTRRGTTIDADLVIVGAGVEPSTELAERGGLKIDDGIAVDEFLQTSVPGIFAAGDVAAARHPRLSRRIRVEHWDNAIQQGIVAAKNMLGGSVPYDRIPYFFSDQYDLGVEYSGYAPAWDRVVFRGDPRSREFIAFWIAGNRVAAAMNANVWDVADDLRSLVAAQQSFPESHLADPDLPLTMLQPVG